LNPLLKGNEGLTVVAGRTHESWLGDASLSNLQFSISNGFLN